MMKNVTCILTVLVLTFSTVLMAQPPWDTDTLDYNHLNDWPPAQFRDKQEQLNATRYYQFGIHTERHADKTWTTIRRVMDFETGILFDLRTSNQSFPQRHMDTLNMKSISNGELVHYANDVSTYVYRKSVNYQTIGHYFVQYNHKTDSWSNLILMGPHTDTQYMWKLGFDMNDRYYYYAHAMQDSVIRRGHNYAPEYHSTRYKLERLDLKQFKTETLFILHMPEREVVLHFEAVLFTPDGKHMVLLEYDDSAYEKDGPNDPPPVAYIIDVEDNSYKTVEIPWTPYGNFITPNSKYLIVGSYLKGSILKIDLDEARVVKQITSTKTIFEFYMAPSGNYFMVIYDYEKTPRKVVDFRSTEDLELLATMQLEQLFGKGAKHEMFRQGLYGRPILSRELKTKASDKKALPILNYLPEYIGPVKPGSPQALALAKAESIAKAKQYIKNSYAEFTQEKYIPKNLEAVSFTSDGNVIISGKRHLDHETSATYVTKLSPEGKVIWETKIPGEQGATSSPGFHFTTNDGGCIMFTRYYHNMKSFGCSRITRFDGSGKITYDYKFIREPNPGHKDVDWKDAVLLPDGSLQLEGLSFVERKQFGQGDWRNLYRPWKGTMSATGVFTETTTEQLQPQEKSYWDKAR
ncbi:MAG: hypothetical protein PVH48_02420 [Cyclobacteriaceae bacterium]